MEKKIIGEINIRIYDDETMVTSLDNMIGNENTPAYEFIHQLDERVFGEYEGFKETNEQ